MEFVKLTHAILRQLKDQGFNILISTSTLDNEDPSWVPDSVDIELFLSGDTSEVIRRSIPLQEIHLLLLDDALENIREEDLIGHVFFHLY